MSLSWFYEWPPRDGQWVRIVPPNPRGDGNTEKYCPRPEGPRAIFPIPPGPGQYGVLLLWLEEDMTLYIMLYIPYMPSKDFLVLGLKTNLHKLNVTRESVPFEW